jgi:hypothetical protein
MRKLICTVVFSLCTASVFAQNKKQSLLSVHPRVMLNYTLYTTTPYGHNYKALPDGARPQLTNNIAAFAKHELVKFADKGDSILRFWYINNTCFTQSKVVLYCNADIVDSILCWPIGEYFAVDAKLFGSDTYRFEILVDDRVVQSCHLGSR